MNDKVTDKRPQFFMVEDAVVSNYELDPYSGWLYIVILKHADRRTGEAFPSITRLTELSKMSRAQVMRSIATLEEKKLIRVERDPIPLEGERRQRKPNHYFILPATDNPQVVSGRDYPSISQQLGVVSGVDCNHNHIEPESINQNSPKPPKGAGKTQSPEIETAIDSIITAYLESTQTIDPHALKNKSKRTDALFMHQQGVKPTLVQEWGKFVRAQDFWKTRAISWRKFAAEILPFKSSYIPRVMIVPAVLFEPAPERAAHDEVIPDTEKEELRQMFEALVNAKDANDVKYS